MLRHSNSTNSWKTDCYHARLFFCFLLFFWESYVGSFSEDGIWLPTGWVDSHMGQTMTCMVTPTVLVYEWWKRERYGYDLTRQNHHHTSELYLDDLGDVPRGNYTHYWVWVVLTDYTHREGFSLCFLTIHTAVGLGFSQDATRNLQSKGWLDRKCWYCQSHLACSAFARCVSVIRWNNSWGSMAAVLVVWCTKMTGDVNCRHVDRWCGEAEP